MESEKLILVVSKHYRFGWKFNIHWAKELPDEMVEILGVASPNDETHKEMPDIHRQLIRLIAEVSEASLMKTFSKQKKMLDFMQEISQKTIDDLIRPRIELNIRKVIHLALQSALPVYLREELSNKTLHAHSLICILPAYTQCIFNFVKDQKGLRYYISMSNEEREIMLQEKPVCVLSQEPCVILLRDKIHRVENIEAKKLIPFFDKPYIPVPVASETKYIQSFILKTIPKYEVKIEGIETTALCPVQRALLILEEDFFQQLTFFLYFEYNNQKINPALRKTKFVKLEKLNGIETICWFVRNLDWENSLIQKLIELGLRQEGENRFYLTQNPEIIQRYGLIGWLNANRDNLSDFTIEQQVGKFFYTGTIVLQSQLNIKIDWFDLDIEVVFDNFRIPFSRFRKHILNRMIEYILPDKTVFILPDEWFHRYEPVFLHSKDTEKGLRLQKMYIGLLNEPVNGLFSEKQKAELQKLKKRPDDQPVPADSLNATLRPYQKEGFYWLVHLHNSGMGGCLADDMGLGKTLQTIALLNYVYAMSEKKQSQLSRDGQLSLFSIWESMLSASLVVVPKSLLHNWQNELKKFAPELKVYMYDGKNRVKTKDVGKIFDRYQVIIISYSIVRTDIAYLREYPFHYIILDESQYIKNPDSLLYQSISKLYASHKLVLTGTPVENSLSDLWAQFNFINPGLLQTFSFFKHHYIQKIKEKNKFVEETLQQLIQPFFLRRTKDEVALDLPPLMQEIVYCDMTESQQEIHDAEKNRIRNILLENQEKQTGNTFFALQGLLRLRLLANHPLLMDANYPGDSGKFDQIILYFESIKANGHKVLIFSSFVKHLKLLSGRFDQEGWKYAMLTGQTCDREAEIERFNLIEDVNCFFISLKAGGTGLNLTAADYVFIIDPWWNPAAEMQALSRSHRIGQDKNVIVYRFISSDSIEEKILRLQQLKLQLFDTFITSNNPLKQLNHEELDALFL